MSADLHNQLRKEFQLERLILFSDAVFAIAITLLVIDIKVPVLTDGEHNDYTILQKLAEQAPKFIGFLVSFLLIGQYWVVHHRLFGYVISFTGRLVWLNIFFLLFIALMPFSTALYSEYVLDNMRVPVIFYSGNIIAIGLLNFTMWRYVGNPAHKLSENLPPELVRFFSWRAMAVPALFLLFSVVYFFSPRVAFWMPPFIPLLLRIFFGSLRKKAVEAHRASPNN